MFSTLAGLLPVSYYSAINHLHDEVGCGYGSDPNVSHNTSSLAAMRTIIWVYGTNIPNASFAVPFYDSCYRVFAQVLSWCAKGRLSGVTDQKIICKDVFCATLASKSGEKLFTHLDLEYGELNEMASLQYWRAETGCEVGNSPWKSLKETDGLRRGSLILSNIHRFGSTSSHSRLRRDL